MALITVKFLLLTTYFTVIVCERVKEKIYDEIQGDMACFKRFNGTHEIGCTSNFRGNIGVIHVVSNDSDLNWVYEKGPHDPYILAVTPDLLTVETLTSAQKSGKVSGVVVLVNEYYDPEDLLSKGFSGDTHCPNEEYSLYNQSGNPEYAEYCSKQPWNPAGTSLLYTSWDFPIFLIDNETSIENIQSCYKEFNEPKNGEPRSWPLCSLELKSHMFGTTNTEVCMRRAALSGILTPVNFCDPLYDFNIWGTIKPMNVSEDLPEKSVIIVGARMDAATMFDNISPAAESAVSGLVTLLSAAEALNRHKEDILESSNNKNIMFILFQGETWDYIGSSRMVWDMEKGEFPFKKLDDESDQMSQINLTHIDHFIEISQVGKMVNNQLYLHSDPISNSDADIATKTNSLVDAFKQSSALDSSIKFQRVDNEVPLPPSSIQSFLKRVNISGLVITDHEKEFKNNYYQSVFDDSRNIQGEDVTNVASALATTLYTLIMDTGPTKKIEANRSFTEELLGCYSKNVSCQIFRDLGGNVLSKDFYNDKPARMYVSVKRGETGRTYLTNNVFAKVLGEEVDMNITECKTETYYQVQQYYYFPKVNNGSCYRTTVRKTVAMSPAFVIENYDWQSGEYSTWAESGWQSMEAMLFLRPSVTEEVALVCGGVASFILSFALVHFMNCRADILFGLTNPPAPC